MPLPEQHLERKMASFCLLNASFYRACWGLDGTSVDASFHASSLLKSHGNTCLLSSGDRKRKANSEFPSSALWQDVQDKKNGRNFADWVLRKQHDRHGHKCSFAQKNKNKIGKGCHTHSPLQSSFGWLVSSMQTDPIGINPLACL